jgi:Flagellar biosynthesis protein, FliO
VEAYFISTFGETFAPFARIATLALLAVAVLWVLWLILRKFRSGLFVSSGGKSNLPRLAVTDAVPVDSSRRLILVRRDDVEHLIMIGGPTDIVVETGIGKPVPMAAQQQPRQPVQATPPQIATQQSATPQPALQPAPQQAVAQQRPPMVAAREAVAEAERDRYTRSPEPQGAERRIEPMTIDPAVAAKAAESLSLAVNRPPIVAAPAQTPHIQTLPVQAPSVPTPPAPTPSTAVAPAVQPRGELDLDKLLDELRPNPLLDRS